MLFPHLKLKIPSLNVERNNGPGHTARMRLWSNFFFFFASTIFCVMAQVWNHLCFYWATARKKLQTACIVNWDCIPSYLCSLIRACAVCSSKILPFFASFLHKISSTPTRWFDSSNTVVNFLCRGSISVGCSSTQYAHTNCAYLSTWDE